MRDPEGFLSVGTGVRAWVNSRRLRRGEFPKNGTEEENRDHSKRGWGVGAGLCVCQRSEGSLIQKRRCLDGGNGHSVPSRVLTGSHTPLTTEVPITGTVTERRDVSSAVSNVVTGGRPVGSATTSPPLTKETLVSTSLVGSLGKVNCRGKD